MRYMLFMASALDAPEYRREDDDIVAWIAATEARGASVLGSHLRPVEDATTIKIRASELIVSDGPFTEAKEWIGGFEVIEAADLDEAIEIAAGHPCARFGKIEIRPAYDLDLTEFPGG